jgi:hypothetical protein
VVVSGKRPPFTDIVNKELNDAKPKYRTRASARIRLPDVTGLTAAVESPAKGGDGYAAPYGSSFTLVLFWLLTFL